MKRASSVPRVHTQVVLFFLRLVSDTRGWDNSQTGRSSWPPATLRHTSFAARSQGLWRKSSISVRSTRRAFNTCGLHETENQMSSTSFVTVNFGRALGSVISPVPFGFYYVTDGIFPMGTSQFTAAFRLSLFFSRRVFWQSASSSRWPFLYHDPMVKV